MGNGMEIGPAWDCCLGSAEEKKPAAFVRFVPGTSASAKAKGKDAL